MPIINRKRPNTGVEDHFLSANTILCCGEDWQELLAALSSITGEKPSLHHEYRCYRISRFATFSLIWSGMGTGCLEPLLFELRGASIIEKLILIGTAGATSTKKINLGELYIVEKAFLGGTAVHLAENRPFEPRFPKDMLSETNLAGASLVSTDYYYGFSENVNSADLRLADHTLQNAVETFLGQVDLVDMETAQFYYFCETFFEKGRLKYVSLKGAANSLADQALQTTFSFEILRKALLVSFGLLDVKSQPQTVANVTVLGPTKEISDSKLMEEVKLFWTIQIAVCGVLGYLGTNLTLNTPDPSSSAVAFEPVLLKNLGISVISLFLLQIGAMYNLIGNYYARVAASGTRFALQQENRITPTLAFFYLAISGLVAALAVKSVIPKASGGLVIASGMAGLFLNALVCRALVYKALTRKGQQTEADYQAYSKPLRRVYFWTMIVLSALALLALYLINALSP